MDAIASLLPLLAALAASLLLVGLLSFCHAVAFRLFPAAPGSVRLCGTWVLGYWAMQTVFALLGSFGLFRLPAVLALLLVAWVGLTRFVPLASIARQIGADLRLLGSQLRDLLVGSSRWIAVAVTAVLAIRLIRGLASPPMAWDALTYHLFKAGRWVQTGAFAPEAGPDALRAYAYMPPGGDIVWAWAMLPFQGDFALALAGLLVWLSIVSAAFGLGRSLGGDARASFLTALGLGATPAVMVFLTASYVDNVSVALVLLGLVFLVRATREPTIQDAALAVAAISCSLCVKITAAPLLALATLAIVWRTFAARRPWAWRARLCAVCLLMGASFAPFYANTWLETGSPVFPWDLTLAGRTIFEGMEFVRTSAAGALTPGVESSAPRFLHLLFVGPAFPGWSFMNLGVGWLALLPLGLTGCVVSWREAGNRWAIALVALFAASTVGPLLSPDMLAMRTHWAPNVGRLLLSGLAPLVVLGAVVPGPVPHAARLLAVIAALLQAPPAGWGDADRHHAMLAAAVILSAAVAAGLLLRYSRRAVGSWAAAGLAGLVVLAAALPLARIRADARYAVYEEVGRDFPRVYDPHPVGPWRDAWPIWRELDDAEGHRIALVAGWSMLGDNWFRYPLLGSRLQNEVLYVPPTRDGEIPDYRFPEALAPRLDRETWIRRLVDSEVDYVVALHPPAPEVSWMLGERRVFDRIRIGKNGRGAAFRLDRDAAIAALRDPPAGAAP